MMRNLHECYRRVAAVILLASLWLMTGTAAKILAQDEQQPAQQNPSETPPAGEDPSAQPAPMDPADPAAEGEASEEEKEPELPTLEEMLAQLPTAEQLVRFEPFDWIVLKKEDRVLMTRPVSPRPNTLAQIEQRVADFTAQKRRPRPGPEADKWVEERDNLEHLVIYLPPPPKDPDEKPAEGAIQFEDVDLEYRIHYSDIKQILHHEDLMLMRVDKLREEKDFKSAYELLFHLARRQPNWPGLAERQDALLFADALAAVEQGDFIAAFARLEEVHARQPQYPGLSEQLGNVSGALVSAAVEANNFRQARHYINRLKRSEANHPVAAEWTAALEQRSQAQVDQAEAAFGEKNYREAALAVAEAARIWPALDGLAETHRRIASRYQQLRVGVCDMPGDAAGYPVPTQPDLRHADLTQTGLFEVDQFPGVARYTTRFFESWDPTDLGREARFTLRRTASEGLPPLTASMIAESISQRIDPSSPLYDERLDGYVHSIRVPSPLELHIKFARIPLRMESMFRFPVTAGSLPADWTPAQPLPESVVLTRRFSRGEQSPSSAWYDRVIPQPDGLAEYHVAEVLEQRYATQDEALQALLRGEITMLAHAALKDVEALSDDERFFVQQYAVPVTHVVQFNPASVRGKNLMLRRALLYGANRAEVLREAVLDGVSGQFARLTTAPWPINSETYNTLIEPREEDVVLGLSLAISAKAQLKDQFGTLTMHCPTDPVARRCAEKLIENWKRVGIEVQISDGSKPAEWDMVYRVVRMAEPNTDVWPFLTLEPRARIEALRAVPDWLRQELIALELSSDWGSALQALRQLHSHLWADVHLIPLWEVDDYVVARSTVRGLPLRPASTYDGVERWSIDPWFPVEEP